MKQSRMRFWILPALLAAGLIVSFFDVVFLGRTILATNFVAGTDPSGVGSWGYEGRRGTEIPVQDGAGSTWVHEPEMAVAARAVQGGEAPLWNPHLACGMPFLAGMSSGLLYPLQWILFVSDAPWVWDAYMLLRLLVSGLFTILFLRNLGVGSIASLFGAFAYMLSGFQVWNVNVVFINSTLLLPLLLYAAQRVACAPSLPSVTILAVGIALEILSGAPEPAALALLCGGAYGLYWIFASPGGPGRIRRSLGGGAVSICLGMGLSAPLWLPFLEFLQASYHLHSPLLGRSAQPFASIARLAAPEVLGRIYEWWDGTDQFFEPGYVGTTVSALVVLAFVDGIWRRRPWSFFAGGAVFCILKIYGMPGFNWVVSSLPVFDRVFVSRFLGPVLLFCLCTLAAGALDRIVKGKKAGLSAANGIIFVLLLLVLWGLWRFAAAHGADGSLLSALLIPGIVVVVLGVLGEAHRRGRLHPLGVGGCILVLMAVELILWVPRTRLDRADPFRVPPYIRELQERQEGEGPFRVTGTSAILHPNTAGAYGLDQIGVTSPLFVGRYMHWVREILGVSHDYIVSGDWVPDLHHPGVDLLNLKYVIGRPDALLDLEAEPGSGVVPGDRAIGEILPGREVGQSFVSRKDGLAAVVLLIPTYKRTNRGSLEFALYEGPPSGKPVRSIRIRMDDIEDNGTQFFPFDPVVDSGGKEFSFTIRSPDASPGNAVTLWLDTSGGYADGQRLEGGGPAEGDLGFGLRYAAAEAKYRLVYDAEVRIFENLHCLPRAHLVPEARWVLGLDEVLEALKEPGFDPRVTVILEGEGGRGPAREGEAVEGETGGSDVRITTCEAGRVKVSLGPHRPGYLVLLDTFYPGWRATVDGKDRPVYPAHGLFRAVRIEEGDREVVFTYRPVSFRVGLLLALLSVLALIGTAVLQRGPRTDGGVLGENR